MTAKPNRGGIWGTPPNSVAWWMKRSFFSNGDRGISWTKTFKLEMLDPNFPGRTPEDVPSFRGRPRLPLQNLCTASTRAKKGLFSSSVVRPRCDYSRWGLGPLELKWNEMEPKQMSPTRRWDWRRWTLTRLLPWCWYMISYLQLHQNLRSRLRMATRINISNIWKDDWHLWKNLMTGLFLLKTWNFPWLDSRGRCGASVQLATKVRPSGSIRSEVWRYAPHRWNLVRRRLEPSFQAAAWLKSVCVICYMYWVYVCSYP